MLNSKLTRIACVCLITCGGAAFGAAERDAADEAMARLTPHAIRADMRFLSDDLLEGRGTGTRGFDIAAAFMMTQFEGMGLKPGGDRGGYLQAVPLLSMKTDPAHSTLAFEKSGTRAELSFSKDFFLRGDPTRDEVSVDAPVVFVGFGITAPELGYDDYKGLDVKGKVVAFAYGAPKFESSLKAHYSPSIEKTKNAAAHGAVGAIVLNDPRLEGMYPFAKRVRDLRIPDYRWLKSDGTPHESVPQIRAFAYLSTEATEHLFQGSGHSAQQIYDGIKKGQLPHFDLRTRMFATTVTHHAKLQGANVVAALEGSDPALKGEYVVFSAHLDHLGRDDSATGDGIYNGALDNGSGSAVMLEVARSFSTMNPRPRRSMLFIAVTGEEVGLLGSDYFANNPTVPKSSIVANINTDEDVMLWPLRDVIAYGAEHSSLGTTLKTAGDRLNLTVSPDPVPDQVKFVRSDQYSFVKQGIPSVSIDAGFKSDDPAIHPSELEDHWEDTRYHQPSDDMEQPGLDFDSATAYARFVLLSGYLIAQDPARPVWNKPDFFGDRFGARAR